MTKERIKSGTPFSDDRNPRAIMVHSAWLRSGIAKRHGSTVLDVGCGKGIHERTLMQWGCSQVVGIDVSMDSLTSGRLSHCDGEYVCADAQTIPFLSESFDCVIMVEVLEHLERVEACLREVHRVLDSQGLLLVTAPNKGFPFLTHGVTIRGVWFNSLLGLPFPLFSYLPRILLRRIWSARCYTAGEFRMVLEAAGFQIENLVFLMPSFDGVLPMTSRMPNAIMRMARKLSEVFNSSESAWFGSSIAVLARRDADSTLSLHHQ